MSVMRRRRTGPGVSEVPGVGSYGRVRELGRYARTEPTLMEIIETHLPSSTESPLLARAFLRATLETWKLDGFGEITELLASELVSNVVVHVGTPMTLRITRHPSAIRVDVEDPSSVLPGAAPPGHRRGARFAACCSSASSPPTGAPNAPRAARPCGSRSTRPPPPPRRTTADPAVRPGPVSRRSSRRGR